MQIRIELNAAHYRRTLQEQQGDAANLRVLLCADLVRMTADLDLEPMVDAILKHDDCLITLVASEPEAAAYQTYHYWLMQARKQGFTSVDHAICDLYRQHQSGAIVGRLLGVTGHTICRHLRRLGQPLQPRGGRRQTQLIRLSYQGETMTMREWSQRTGLPIQTLHTRRWKGWTVEQILTTPCIKRGYQRCRKK